MIRLRILLLCSLFLFAAFHEGHGEILFNSTDLDSDGLQDIESPALNIKATNSVTQVSHLMAISNGKLLIDRSHNESFDVSGFTNFLVSQGWIVDELTAGPITETLLSSYDVLMIPTIESALEMISKFQTSEIIAVTNYVLDGGGLWVFHEYRRDPTNVNTIAGYFGVTFNYDIIYEIGDEFPNSWPTIYLLKSHAITQGVSNYVYYAGCSLNVNNPDNVIGEGDDNAFSISYPAGQLIYSSYPPVLAAVEYGNGCAVFSGDITPLYPGYYNLRLEEKEKLLLSNIVEWLATCIKVSVIVDIKPGSDTNSINLKSKGKIPVAILSTKDFDAPNQIDLESLTFGRTCDEQSLAFCHGSEDVNGDGLKDLVCHFYTRQTGFQCGNTEGILKGKTTDGTSIEGRDSVRIVPCK